MILDKNLMGLGPLLGPPKSMAAPNRSSYKMIAV